MQKEEALNKNSIAEEALLLAKHRQKTSSLQRLIKNPRLLSGHQGRPFIYDMDKDELEAWFAYKKLPKYRATQLFAWIKRGLENSEELTDFPKALRADLDSFFDLRGLNLTKVYHSNIDPTTKYVYTLADGNGVEAVYMEYKHGTSVCLSSQAGCRMGCGFCASTGLGFVRNLSSGELLAQVARIAKDKRKRIDNIVIMGIGEPLENYEEVTRFIKTVNNKDGLNIGMRHITLSTCGLVPEIKRLADENIQITLAISLHAPNNELRASLMPVNRRYSIEELMEASSYYVEKTGRRLTFEYAMFKDINDSKKEARELVKLLLKYRIHCHINLIPANEFTESPFKRSKPEQIRDFQKILNEAGFSCTIRRELGRDISAACGQLRRKLNL